MDLREFLVRWQFWGLEAMFAFVVVTTVLEIRRLGLDRFLVAGAIVLSIGATWLTATVPPRTNRIYYDEQIYQGIAQNMASLHRTQMCNEGVVEYGTLTCIRGEYNKQPYGYPYLLSIFYRLFGVGENIAFNFNNVMAGLAVFITIALTELLFSLGWGSLLAGASIALLPMQLDWSATAASEPSSSVVCGAAMLALVHYLRRRTGSALAWTIALMAFALTMRPESIVLAPVALLAIVLLARDEFMTPRPWIGAAAGLVAALTPILHLALVRDEGWGTTGPRMAWEYVKINGPVNAWFYFSDPRFPGLIGIAAVIGLVARDRLKERAIVAAYFFAFWLMFVFFYAGSYNYGADVRYSLMTYIPIACLAGAGLTRVAAAGARLFDSKWAAAGVVIAAVLSLINYFPLVRATGEEAWAARADVAFAREFARTLPPNSMVLTQNPSMFHLWGINAAQLSIAQVEPNYVRQAMAPRYAGGVYVHWSFWCNVNDPVQVKFCRETLATFSSDKVSEYQERDYHYAFYRLKLGGG